MLQCCRGGQELETFLQLRKSNGWEKKTKQTVQISVFRSFKDRLGSFLSVDDGDMMIIIYNRIF